MRGTCKDFLCLLEKNALIDLNSLKDKKLNTNVEFTFVTQCFSRNFQKKLKKARVKKESPNALVMNSRGWDITRWAPESVTKCQSNTVDLLEFLEKNLPAKTRVLWITTPQISNEPLGGFFVQQVLSSLQVEFLKPALRFDILDANVSREFILRGYDVSDVHYHLLQIHRRLPDGVHWSPEGVRHITNLFLTHSSISRNVFLPGIFKSPLLDKLRLKATEMSTTTPESHEPVIVGNGCANRRETQSRKNNMKKGKKRDYNGNYIGQAPVKIDFFRNFINHDSRRKRFRMAGRGHC